MDAEVPGTLLITKQYIYIVINLHVYTVCVNSNMHTYIHNYVCIAIVAMYSSM